MLKESVVGVFLACGYAVAATWVDMVDSQDFALYVDSQSVVAKDTLVHFSIKVEYKSSYPLMNGTPEGSFIKQLAVDCEGGTLASGQTTAYAPDILYN